MPTAVSGTGTVRTTTANQPTVISLALKLKPKLARSNNWTTIRRNHLKQQPTCQACNTKTKLIVHHIIPVHIDKDKELDPSNLITLCENPNSGYCHFIFGHLAINWWKWDPNVTENVTHHLGAVLNAVDNQDARGKAT